MKGLPSRGDVEPGDVPTLMDLGLNPSATTSQDGRPAAIASVVGGETEALERLKKYAAECQAQPPKTSKDGNHDSIYGANFSSKVSPWLVLGCLSPRSMFDELKKTSSREEEHKRKDKAKVTALEVSFNFLGIRGVHLTRIL